MNRELVEIVFISYDWVMLPPIEGLDTLYSRVDNKKLRRVPCIRIYGHIQSTGDSACLILHDYFPSFLMRKPVDMHKLQFILDEVSRDSYPIFDATIHKKLDIYGFSPEPVEMVKIKTVSPIDVAKFAGAIQERFPGHRLYNVHVPYLLQFLVDYNLQGLSVIQLDAASVRLPADVHSPQTFCKIELHANVAAIRNSLSSSHPKNYPVPKPLVYTTHSQAATPLSGFPATGLICGSALDPVWQEEAERCERMRIPFPYEPEGIESGVGRPSVHELDFVQTAVEEIKRLSESPNFANTLDRLDRVDLEVTNSQFAAHSEDEDDQQAQPPPDDSDDEVPPTILLSTQRPFSDRSLTVDVRSCSQRPPTLVENLADAADFPTAADFDENAPAVGFLAEARSQLLVFPPPPKNPGFFVRSSDPSNKRWSLSASNAATPRLKDVVGTASKDKEHLTYNTLLGLELVVARKEGAVNLDAEADALVGFLVLSRDQRLGGEDQDQLLFHCIWATEEESFGGYADIKRVAVHSNELELLESLVSLFRDLDPCVLLAWDFTKLLKYVGRRAALVGLTDWNLSRLVDFDPVTSMNPESLPGRVTLDLWRLLRSHESGLNLGTTSFEGCVQAVLGLTFPSVPMSTLAAWLQSEDASLRLRATRHVCRRTRLLVEMLDASMLLDRAVEMARIYGCDVASVLSRGSQFRVECMLTRACRRSGFALVSSSKQQVKNQMAPEGIPLVLEPKSGFYSDPVCVLDFQSLYPSIMIAYNICYSTCLGKVSDRKVANLGTQGLFERDLRSALNLPGGVIGTPGDVMFVGRETRVGILPRMLHEVIQTRFMVKRAMKKAKSKTLSRTLDARQLTLKLLANVTYGYTGASFSGRMPCGEVADAIVLTGRRTLERAMATAEAMGGEVIYGDTDSLFVRFKQASLEEAFTRGYALADAVTKANPWPMKLQMEKVYWPCCMITKKRYVGRAFEAPHAPPRFDAKGIETVRRDNCPLTAKTLAKVLEALFENPTVSHPEMTLHAAVKKEIGRIYRHDGTRNIRDFVFQNQVRTGYKDPDHLPPAARVAANQDLQISSGQRVAYVVVRRGPEALLSEQVESPSEVTAGRAMIDIDYYVNRQILPALQRTLGIQLSASLSRWIKELPKRRIAQSTASAQTLTLRRCRCLVCGGKATKPLGSPVYCEPCLSADAGRCIAVASGNWNRAEARMHALRSLCISCAGDATQAAACTDAFHCSVYFDREREARVWTETKEDFVYATRALGAELDW